MSQPKISVIETGRKPDAFKWIAVGGSIYILLLTIVLCIGAERRYALHPEERPQTTYPLPE
jgi:hypothetical protein